MSLPRLSLVTILGPGDPVFTSQCLLLWAEMISLLLTPLLPLTDLTPCKLVFLEIALGAQPDRSLRSC